MEKPLMLVIRDTYKLWANYMKAVAGEAGVPDSYRMVLIFLLRHPGSSQKELAAHCGITTASVSQTVKEMELTGYLEKKPDAKDQRYVKLFLTAKGRSCGERIRKRINQTDARISERLTPEGEKKVREMMGELAQILEKELPECYTI